MTIGTSASTLLSKEFIACALLIPFCRPELCDGGGVYYSLRWPFFLFFENFESMQRNSKTRASEPAETSAIESSSKSGLEKVFKS